MRCAQSSTRPISTATTRRGDALGPVSGASLGNAARDAYVRELDGALLPRVAARLEQRLVEYASEPEKLFEYLKAYMMLGEPRHVDKKHLQFVADLEWHAADTADPDAGARLSKHFRRCSSTGTRCGRSR